MGDTKNWLEKNRLNDNGFLQSMKFQNGIFVSQTVSQLDSSYWSSTLIKFNR